MPGRSDPLPRTLARHSFSGIVKGAVGAMAVASPVALTVSRQKLHPRHGSHRHPVVATHRPIFAGLRAAWELAGQRSFFAASPIPLASPALPRCCHQCKRPSRRLRPIRARPGNPHAGMRRKNPEAVDIGRRQIPLSCFSYLASIASLRICGQNMKVRRSVRFQHDYRTRTR